MILFLDFDGVLHPDPCRDDQLFANSPLLASVLADFPEASVVLSTSWRTFLDLDRLVAPLDPELQRRVIGVTPRFSEITPAPGLVPYRRQAECVQWLDDNGVRDAAWLALDDRASWFEPYCDNLIACDSLCGFDDAAAARLRSALLRGRRHMAQAVDAAL